MEAAIVYDNTAASGFKSGWGFSCIVDRRILFDTGEDPDPFFYNLGKLNIDVNQIEAVVISHDHWDHTGGLEPFIQRRKGVQVYACPGFGSTFHKKVRHSGGTLVEGGNYREIDPTIAVTGEIAGEYRGRYMPEQALIVKTGKGISVITGCSHPGIVRMVQNVSTIHPHVNIRLVMGGFHLIDKDAAMIQDTIQSLIDLGVEYVGPTHCTGDEAVRMFREAYCERCLNAKAGLSFEL